MTKVQKREKGVDPALAVNKFTPESIPLFSLKSSLVTLIKRAASKQARQFENFYVEITSEKTQTRDHENVEWTNSSLRCGRTCRLV